MSATGERDVGVEQVQEEHLAAVTPRTQWLYLFGVLGLGFLLMVVLIAILGAGSGG